MTAEEIKQLREKLGLSQEAFARKLGVSWQAVSRWERGIYKPLPVFERKLIKLLKKEGG